LLESEGGLPTVQARRQISAPLTLSRTTGFWIDSNANNICA